MPYPRVLRFVTLAAVAMGLALATDRGAAQAPPPPVPGTFYGTVSGGPAIGDTVVAFVVVSNNSANCGSTIVISDGGQPVYAVDVFADHVDSPGCGATNRVVRFYFPRTHQFAAPTGSWKQGPNELNLAASGALNFRNYPANAANDQPH